MSAEAAREASFRRKKFKDRYQKTNQFEAVALTDGYKLTQKETAGITPSAGGSTSGSPPNRFARQAFRGRILGDFSPHLFLKNPCDLGEATNPYYTTALILQHTEFLLTEDYYDSSGQTTINRNDRVNVYLEPGPAGTPFNLERGWCIGVNRSGRTSAQDGDRAIDCTTLQEIFDSSTGASSMGGAGATGTGSAGEVRQIDFDAEYKHPGPCTPGGNSSATNVKDYFGTPGWNAYVEKLGSFETGGTWRADLDALESRDALASAPGMIGRYQFTVHSMYNAGFITDEAYTSIGGRNYGHQTVHPTADMVERGVEYTEAEIAAIRATQKKVLDMYKDSNSWKSDAFPDDAEASMESFLESQDLQNIALEDFTTKNLQTLKGMHMVDIDNAADVAGMLGASHLKGPGGARTMRNGTNIADGFGSFPTKYYTGIGSVIPCSS